MSEAAPGTLSRLRIAAGTGIVLVACAAPFSIAAAQTLLALTVAAWLAILVQERRWPAAPRFFVPLIVYAAVTLLSAALSSDPASSLADCKQLTLFVIVPMVYDLVPAAMIPRAITAIVTAGAVSALVGVVQSTVLDYNQLQHRPTSTLGMYMTFSGITMLVLSVALARVLFASRGRLWPALLLPAIVVALALSLSRSAWVGACAAGALLLLMKDFRLVAVLPLAAALLLAFAPARVTLRFYSIFDMQDATIRDRVAMLQAGTQIVRAHPFTGLGPNMVEREYHTYRVPGAVLEATPHLHNVPMQIAAERGLPALAVWLWFVMVAAIDLWHRFRVDRERWLTAAALGSIMAMFAAGLFEYNFGDSEFLMLFLVIVTLPFAAARVEGASLHS